jgi:capsid portal protein
MPPDDTRTKFRPEGESIGRIQQRNTSRGRVTGSRKSVDKMLSSQGKGSTRLKEMDQEFRKGSQEVLSPPYPFQDLASLMEEQPVHYACVMAKASCISGVGWKVEPNINEMAITSELLRLSQMDSPTEDEKERMDFLLHELIRLDEEKTALISFFTRPNPDDTFQELSIRTDIDKQALGNGFWEIVRDENYLPFEIYHIPAISCRLLANMTGVAQVRSVVHPFQTYITPQSQGKKLTTVYFRFYGKPYIMDWRTGRIHGIFLSSDQVESFLSSPVNKRDDGTPLYVRSETLVGDAAPPGFVSLWITDEHGKFTVLPREFWANEVKWWKKYSVKQGDGYGTPDIIPALAACAGTRGAHRYQLDYFDNAAIPKMVVLMKGFPPGDPEDDEDPLEAATQFFDRELRNQYHRTLVLEAPASRKDADSSQVDGASIDIEKLTERMEEAGFLDYLKNNRDEIMLAERTPQEILASFDSDARASSSGVSIGLEVFKEFVIRPEQQSIERSINRLIQEDFGLNWSFKFLQLDSLDELREMQIATGYYNIHAITINEIRSRRGMDPLPGGDRPFAITPIGIVFLDDIEKLSTSQVAETPSAPLQPAGQGSPQGRGNRKEEEPQDKESNNFSLPQEVYSKNKRKVLSIGDKISLNQYGISEDKIPLLMETFSFSSNGKKR